MPPEIPVFFPGNTSSVCVAGTFGGFPLGIPHSFVVVPVASVTSYFWTVPAGWVILSGQGTVTMVARAEPGAVNGNITVTANNGFGSSPAAIIPVEVINCSAPPPIPKLLYKTDPMCQLTNPAYFPYIVFEIDGVNPMTGYNWTLPPGWNTGGPGSSVLSFSTNGAGAGVVLGPQNITVTATNGFGTSPALSITVDVIDCTLPDVAKPEQPYFVNSLIACINDPLGGNVGCYGIPNATSYFWTVPFGWTITSGQGTNNITAIAGPLAVTGDVTVVAINSLGASTVAASTAYANNCGNNPPNLPVFTDTTYTVCNDSGQNITYSVANDPLATSYTWIFPSGWTIISGQGTNSVVVSPSPLANLGLQFLQVTASNAYGTSAPAQFQVNVIICPPPPPPPPVPVFTDGDALLCKGTAGTFTVRTEPGTISYNWAVPFGWVINSGQGSNSIVATPGPLAVNGNITCTITNPYGTGLPGYFAVVAVVCPPVPPTCEPILLTDTICEWQTKLNGWLGMFFVDASARCNGTDVVLTFTTCDGTITEVTLPICDILPCFVPDSILAVIRPYDALTVDILPGNYSIGCDTYTLASPTSVSISGGDPALSRIDAIVIDALGVVTVIAGAFAAVPVPPVVGAAFRLIAYVYVRPQATFAGQTSLCSLVAHVPNGSVNHSTLRWNTVVHQEDTLFQHDGFTRAWFGLSTDPLVPIGGGQRLSYMPDLLAFRLGQAGANQWDVPNIGVGSVAFGLNTIAFGQYSGVFGQLNSAIGGYGFIQGLANTIDGTAFASTIFGQNNSITLAAVGFNFIQGSGNSITGDWDGMVATRDSAINAGAAFTFMGGAASSTIGATSFGGHLATQVGTDYGNFQSGQIGGRFCGVGYSNWSWIYGSDNCTVHTSTYSSIENSINCFIGQAFFSPVAQGKQINCSETMLGRGTAVTMLNCVNSSIFGGLVDPTDVGLQISFINDKLSVIAGLIDAIKNQISFVDTLSCGFIHDYNGNPAAVNMHNILRCSIYNSDGCFIKTNSDGVTPGTRTGAVIMACTVKNLEQDYTFMTGTIRSHGGVQMRNEIKGGDFTLARDQRNITYVGTGTITLPAVTPVFPQFPLPLGQEYWIVSETLGATVTLAPVGTTINGLASIAWSPVTANLAVKVWYDGAEWKCIFTA